MSSNRGASGSRPGPVFNKQTPPPGVIANRTYNSVKPPSAPPPLTA